MVAEADVYRELWVSLAALLRSYTTVHGLYRNRQATVELGKTHIVVRHAEKWLHLKRSKSRIKWQRESGTSGEFELTESGTVRSGTKEEEMDMAAETWARELMQ